MEVTMDIKNKGEEEQEMITASNNFSKFRKYP